MFYRLEVAVIKIERIGKRKVLIIIPQNEVNLLSTKIQCPETQDNSSFELIQKISKFLKKEKILFESKNKAIIELLPQDGGYVIFIMLNNNAPSRNRKIYRIKGITEPVIFKFQTVEDLILAVNNLSKYKNKILKCHLIGKNGKYFFIIHPNGSLFEKIKFIMCEYGNLVGKGDHLCAALKEQGKILIEDDALQTLNKYFS